MANITLNENAKKQIIRTLREEGYPTYAWLLESFDIYLTDDPNVVGYMLPGKARIVLNEELSIDQVSTIVRHELLHEWLNHGPRGTRWEKEHPDRKTNHDLSNIAADYEISNRGYTEKDKRNARSLKLGGQVLQGLVTEDQHPDWVDLSFEEMYDKLTAEYTKDMDKLMKEIQPLLDAINKMNPKDLDDLIDQAQQQAQGNPQGDSDNSQSQPGDSDKDSDKSSQQQTGAAGDSQAAKDLRDQAGKAADQLGKIQDKVTEIEDGQKGSFGDDADQEAKAKLGERVAEIQKRLNDIKAKQQAIDEAEGAVQKEKIAAAQKKEWNKTTSALSRFRMNFQRFIKDQIDTSRGDTWHRPNKNYTGSGYIMPGKTMYQQTRVPKINVYWDVSGSFDNPNKTAGARAAIGTVNKYVKTGQVMVDVYYFADRVSSTQGGAGGGTNGQPILDHIQQTKPTNVIVITDGDISDCRSDVEVPGAVWMLFYYNQSQNLKDHLKGKQETRSFLVEYGEE